MKLLRNGEWMEVNPNNVLFMVGDIFENDCRQRFVVRSVSRRDDGSGIDVYFVFIGTREPTKAELLDDAKDLPGIVRPFFKAMVNFFV